MNYVLVFINAIVVALMAMYVYKKERRIEELSAMHVQTDEVKRLSSLMESEKKRLKDENVQLERRIYNLEEKLKEKSVKLDDMNEKSVKLERSVIGRDEVMTYVTKRLEHLEMEKKRLEDELKTRTLILDETLKEESVKLDDKCFRLEEKCVSLERSNVELVLEVNKIKESIAPQSVVGGATNVIPKVGFSAVLTHDVTLGPLQAIEYDKVITNIGQGYDSISGHFKAPVGGLYIISATSYSSGNQNIWSQIVKNKEQLAAMFGRTFDSASHTLVVSLQKNDQIWVRNFGQTTTAHAGGDRYYCSFSGVLIAAL